MKNTVILSMVLVNSLLSFAIVAQPAIPPDPYSSAGVMAWADAQLTADDRARLNELVKQLEAEKIDDRRQALVEMRALGPKAIPAIPKMLSSALLSEGDVADSVNKTMQSMGPKRIAVCIDILGKNRVEIARGEASRIQYTYDMLTDVSYTSEMVPYVFWALGQPQYQSIKSDLLLSLYQYNQMNDVLTKRIISTYLMSFRNDEDPEIRRHALLGVYHLGIDQQAVAKDLLKELEAGKIRDAHMLLWDLSQRPELQLDLEPILWKMYDNSINKYMRENTLNQLGSLPRLSKKSVERIEKIIESDDKYVRGVALVLYIKVGRKRTEATRKLFEMIDKADSERKSSLLNQLSMFNFMSDQVYFDREVAKPYLMKLAASKSVEVRYPVMQLLAAGRYNDEAVREVLKSFSSDDDDLIRNQISMMRDFSRPGGKEALIQLLNDKNAGNRVQAVHMVYGLGMDAKSMIPELEKLLKDPHAEVRFEAKTAIKIIKTDQHMMYYCE